MNILNMKVINKWLSAIFSILTLFLLFPLFVHADQVVPSDRVETHVNVREQPSAQSEVKGTLAKNESAELLESVPYWHKVKLTEDTEGYVSKAWTRVILGATEVVSTTGKTDLIIGSWNIKWFGYYSEDRHDYSRMSEIIEKFDVVTIQELRGSRYKNRLDKLINELSERGYKYTYVVSDLTGYRNHLDENHSTAPKKDYLERYAFMWDIDRIELADPLVSYKFVVQPRINNDTFRQVPIYSDFKVKNGNGFDFRILTIHTVYNKPINAVRRAEIQYIHNWIINQVGDSLNPEKNIIAIGDFNANPKDQPQHFDDIITGTTKYRLLMNEPLRAGEASLRTTVQQKDNPEPGYFEISVYDHALVSNETSYALPHNPMTRSGNDLGIVEFDQEEHWQQLGDWKAMIRAMSDHRPIWFRADYVAEDRD